MPGPQRPDPAPASRLPLLPAGFDLATFVMVVACLALLYFPTYARLAATVWASDEQGHGPIILGASAWLMYRKRAELAALPNARREWPGWVVLCLGMLCFAFGHSQAIVIVEVGSQIIVLAGLLLLFKGTAGLRLCWFALFFLIFMVPLPGPLVAAVTTPLKSAVSAVATLVLHHLGYPIGRSGVVLTIGPYQLLVADACAGLNSMFTLEALCLLYMNLMGYQQPMRNVLLALSAIPIAFCANVVRVVFLVLITYHFGDEAGQGFVHGFAGMVLFMVALMLIIFVDHLVGAFQRRWSRT
jgi:exosortase B